MKVPSPPRTPAYLTCVVGQPFLDAWNLVVRFWNLLIPSKTEGRPWLHVKPVFGSRTAHGRLIELFWGCSRCYCVLRREPDLNSEGFIYGPRTMERCSSAVSIWCLKLLPLPAIAWTIRPSTWGAVNETLPKFRQKLWWGEEYGEMTKWGLYTRLNRHRQNLSNALLSVS
jgi:hypothetical protein